MKKIIIHIGTPKTGSTTLQNFFSSNDFNCDKKVKYSKTDYIRNKNGSFLLLPRSSYFFKKSINIIKDDLKIHDVIVLSDEILSFHFVYNNIPFFKDYKKIKPANIKENFIFLLKMFPDVNFEFLVYLRRQDEYIESEFKETLKGFGLKSNVKNSSFKQQFDNYVLSKEKMLDYKSWINELTNIIGKNRLIIKSFDNCVKDGLINDFVKTFNLNFSKEIIDKYEKMIKNVSFSFVYLYVFNLLIKKSSINLFKDYIYKYSYLDTYPNYQLLNVLEKRKFMAKYIKGNYLIGKSICYKDKDFKIFSYKYNEKSKLFKEDTEEIKDLLIKLIKEFTINELATKSNKNSIEFIFKKIKNKIKIIKNKWALTN